MLGDEYEAAIAVMQRCSVLCLLVVALAIGRIANAADGPGTARLAAERYSRNEVASSGSADDEECFGVQSWIIDRFGHVYVSHRCDITETAMDSQPSGRRPSNRRLRKRQDFVDGALKEELSLSLLQDSNVVIDARESNITVTRIINVSSGRSVIKIREHSLQMKVDASRSNVQIDPSMSMVNISATAPVVELAGGTLRAYLTSGESLIHVSKKSQTNTSLIEVVSGASNFSLGYLHLFLKASSQVYSGITVQPLASPQPSKLVIEGAPLATSMSKRNVTVSALVDSFNVTVLLVDCSLYFSSNSISIALAPSSKQITISTPFHVADIFTSTLPYVIEVVETGVYVKVANSSIGVNFGSLAIEGHFPESMTRINADNASMIRFSTASPSSEPPQLFYSATIDIKANTLHVSSDPQSRHTLVSASNSSTVVRNLVSTLRVRANRSTVSILAGYPTIHVFTDLINVNITVRNVTGPVEAMSSTTSTTTVTASQQGFSDPTPTKSDDPLMSVVTHVTPSLLPHGDSFGTEQSTSISATTGSTTVPPSSSFNLDSSASVIPNLGMASSSISSSLATSSPSSSSSSSVTPPAESTTTTSAGSDTVSNAVTTTSTTLDPRLIEIKSEIVSMQVPSIWWNSSDYDEKANDRNGSTFLITQYFLKSNELRDNMSSYGEATLPTSASTTAVSLLALPNSTAESVPLTLTTEKTIALYNNVSSESVVENATSSVNVSNSSRSDAVQSSLLSLVVAETVNQSINLTQVEKALNADLSRAYREGVSRRRRSTNWLTDVVPQAGVKVPTDDETPIAEAEDVPALHELQAEVVDIEETSASQWRIVFLVRRWHQPLEATVAKAAFDQLSSDEISNFLKLPVVESVVAVRETRQLQPSDQHSPLKRAPAQNASLITVNVSIVLMVAAATVALRWRRQIRKAAVRKSYINSVETIAHVVYVAPTVRNAATSRELPQLPESTQPRGAFQGGVTSSRHTDIPQVRLKFSSSAEDRSTSRSVIQTRFKENTRALLRRVRLEPTVKDILQYIKKVRERQAHV